MSTLAEIAAAGSPSRAWWRETFRGVTRPRAGVLLAYCVWIALGSYPTGNAIMAGDWIGGLKAWIAWSIGLALCYGPPVLALLAVANRSDGFSRKTVAIVAGTVVAGGVYYSGLLSAVHLGPLHEIKLSTFLAITLEGMVEIAVVGALLILLARRDHATQALRQAQYDRVALDREIAEARVMALQSQIEPHFLFNTLANVRRLLATDRSAGRQMVRQLSQYLRSSLPKLRDARSSLGRELALTTAYLCVQQVRMGDRLAVTVDVPARLATASFPPMMLMTLVENAIKHGIAPVPEGGRIMIEASEQAGRLHVRVIDTGAGIKSMSGAGIGIANTKARLHALFGADGRLRIGNNDAGQGVTASIELPLTFAAQGRHEEEAA